MTSLSFIGLDILYVLFVTSNAAKTRPGTPWFDLLSSFSNLFEAE